MHALMRPELILLLSFLALPAIGEARGETPRNSQAAGQAFLEAGVFLGTEDDLPFYQESNWRLRLEAGYDFMERDSRRMGLGFSIQPSADDFRLSANARWRRVLGEDWSVQCAAGPLYSGESQSFGLGWEASIGTRHRHHASVNLLYQSLPYSVDPVPEGYPGELSGSHRAVYAGLVLHDRPGILGAVAMLAGLAVLMLLAVEQGV